MSLEVSPIYRTGHLRPDFGNRRTEGVDETGDIGGRNDRTVWGVVGHMEFIVSPVLSFPKFLFNKKIPWNYNKNSSLV